MTDVEASAEPRRNRSSEEFAMRRVIDAWGRARWPSARVVHELVVGDRRVDMAFIERDRLFAIEIKSSRDTLDRLSDQMRTFRQHLPCIIVALAPKWAKPWSTHSADGRLICDAEAQAMADEYMPHRHDAQRRDVTSPLLHLLWAEEARAVAMRKRLDATKTTPLYKLIPIMARALTGDEIVREVCRELRMRNAFPKAADHPPSDPPLPGEEA